MSAITDQANRIAAFQNRVDAAVEGITTDIESLKKLIEQLQNTPGAITPEDQALLDNIEARTAKVADKVEALDNLDPATPADPNKPNPVIIPPTEPHITERTERAERNKR